MRCVTYTGAGGNEVVACEERPDPVCGDEEVLIHAAFAGINGADVSQRQGNYPAPPGWPSDVPGLEVTATGRRIDGYRWQPAQIEGGRPVPVAASERAARIADWKSLRACTDLR